MRFNAVETDGSLGLRHSSHRTQKLYLMYILVIKSSLIIVVPTDNYCTLAMPNSILCFVIFTWLMMLQTLYQEAAGIMLDCLLQQCSNLKTEVVNLQTKNTAAKRG